MQKKVIYGEMSRAHVRGMMCPNQGRGYDAALQVLRERNARPDFFVYLEELKKEHLKAARQKTAAYSIQPANGRWLIE